MALRPHQAALIEVFKEHGIREGDFTLASGRTSKWYLDGRAVTFRGDCFELIGKAILEAIEASGGCEFDAAGGLVVGAVPVALSVALASGKRSFAVRKEPKGHGIGGRIAGPVSPGERVLVVEDTATSGGSLIEAVDALEELGCIIAGATVLLDRGGELGALLAARSIPYFPVLNAPDVGHEFGS